jgi:hypothetical protein
VAKRVCGADRQASQNQSFEQHAALRRISKRRETEMRSKEIPESKLIEGPSSNQTVPPKGISKESSFAVLREIFSYSPVALLFTSLAVFLICLVIDTVSLITTGQATTPMGTYRFLGLVARIL